LIINYDNKATSLAPQGGEEVRDAKRGSGFIELE